MIESPDKAANILKLMANANRLVMLRHLAKGELNVGELEKLVDMSQPVLSQHLARMRNRGVVKARRDGQHVYYSIAHPAVLPLLDLIEDIFEAEDA